MKNQSGASLLELLVVLVIAGILVTFAVAQFGRSRDNIGRQNIAREFKVSLERARFDSVKRRASSVGEMSTVKLLSATSFSYTTDLNQNGRIENPVETRTVDFGNRSDVQVTGTGFIYPVTISFDQRGQITAKNSADADINPLFYFCNGPCTVSTANAANSNIIYVSPTGTVAMLKGGEAVPTFGNPAVTSVASNTSVNPLLAVWTAASSTPTPSPSPTPSASPTPTPSPTPSVTPTPIPIACQAGENPSITGCICQSPMWVRSNGRCR